MDLTDANLSTDRTHQEEFSFSFIEKNYAFRILLWLMLLGTET